MMLLLLKLKSNKVVEEPFVEIVVDSWFILCPTKWWKNPLLQKVVSWGTLGKLRGGL